MTETTTTATITDDMCRAAIEAGKIDRIQGFSYGPEFSAPHVLRDVYRLPGEQEIWRGDSHDEMMERSAIEEMRLQLAAALAASPASPSAAQGWMPIATAPKDGAPVLIWGANLCVPGEMVVGIRSDEHDDLELWDIHDGKYGPHRLRGPSPTHWMPLPAAPGTQPAQPDAKERCESTYRIRITPDMTYDQINAAAAAEEARAEALTQAAKRIAWEMRDRLSVRYVARDADSLWELLTTPVRDAALSAARAAAPAAPEADDPLDTPLPCEVALPGMKFGKGVKLRTLVDAASRWKVIAAKVPLKDMEPALEEARESGFLTDMPPAALRSAGEGK